MKKAVVIGFVGTQLDSGGKGLGRWEKWRPSVALCQHEDFLVHRFELLYWQVPTESSLATLLGAARCAEIDLFDQLQLGAILNVCQSSQTLAEAGRKLFAVSIGKKRSTNDTDRLRKYLARFGLDWQAIQGRAPRH